MLERLRKSCREEYFLEKSERTEKQEQVLYPQEVVN
jgi:hypothetical protein